MTILEQLKQMSVLVADTGDIEAIKKYQPQDATTNPSLLLKAADIPEYVPYLEQAKAWAAQQDIGSAQQLDCAVDKLAVDIGTEILKTIPGRISTEIDATFSFDTAATIERAKIIVDLYEQAGVDKQRVLIKIASTWEGIQAAEVLEKQGINCNLTLLFGFHQAVACADAGVTLISPFVGRVLDWYKKNTGQDYAPAEEPGVLSVKQIYNYYKYHGYKTIVMGASFRNIGEIMELAGCDNLTISPQLMEELGNQSGELSRKLDPNNIQAVDKQPFEENAFRWAHNEDAMATEKLAEGIRNFAKDLNTLKQRLKS